MTLPLSFIQELQQKIITANEKPAGSMHIGDLVRAVHECSASDAEAIKKLPLHMQLKKIVNLYAENANKTELTTLGSFLQSLPETNLLTTKTRIRLLIASLPSTKNPLRLSWNYVATVVSECFRTCALYLKGTPLVERTRPFIDFEIACDNAKEVLDRPEKHILSPEVFSALMKFKQSELERTFQALQKQIPALQEKDLPQYLNLIQAIKKNQEIYSTIPGRIHSEQLFIENEIQRFLHPYLTGQYTDKNEDIHRPSLPSKLLPMIKILSPKQAECHMLASYLEQSAIACLPPIQKQETESRGEKEQKQIRWKLQAQLNESVLPGFTQALKHSLRIDFRELNLTDKEIEFLAAWGLHHMPIFDERAPLPENWRDAL